MSSSALEHLSPAFPQRAAWGTASSLRAWQQEALDLYEREQPRDFLCVATPGAGKTTFALRVAAELLQRSIVQRIVIVAPTEHLKTQWAEAASRVGIHIDPGFTNAQGGHGRHFFGCRESTGRGGAWSPGGRRARPPPGSRRHRAG